MRHAAHLTIAAALAVAGLAGPAAAEDLLYKGSSALTEGAIDTPYWKLQAECAGFFGATSAWLSDKGDAAGAETAKTNGVAFFQDATTRLVSDRGVTKEVAVATISEVMDASRAAGLNSIRTKGMESRSSWNITRSVCLDVKDAYRTAKMR